MHYAISPELLPKIRLAYVRGQGSVKSIAEKYGVGASFRTVQVKASKQKWKEERERHLNAIVQNSLKKAENEAQEWERNVKNTCKDEWALVTRSIKGIGQEIDPEAISGYARTRKILDDMARRSLGLVDPAQRVDITSAGKSLGESFVSAIAKLRNSNLPKLTETDLKMVMECEVVSDDHI